MSAAAPNHPIRALSFDLDDTLWPIAPVIERAEAELDAWLRAHCPDVGPACSSAALRHARIRLAAERPELAHDHAALRRLTLAHALAPHGYGADLVERAYAIFDAARHEVELFADARAALERCAARYPLAAVTNGTADVARLGLAGLFAAHVNAIHAGAPKPAPAIFRRAAEALGVPCAAIVHIGDDPIGDVAGARACGMRTIWLNRFARGWPLADLAPDLEIATLADLDDALALLDR